MLRSVKKRVAFFVAQFRNKVLHSSVGVIVITSFVFVALLLVYCDIITYTKDGMPV